MTPAASGEWIQILLLGGLLGAVGQAARAVVGIKKVNDQAAAENSNPEDLIVASRLFISLTIGFVAGVLAILVMEVDLAQITTAQILGLAAAGYAGTDFVEGIISKVIPSTSGGGSGNSNSVPANLAAPRSSAPSDNTAAMQSAWVTTSVGREGGLDTVA